MTIGIGFKCIDGIVIAADTQYTFTPYKTHGPKIITVNAPNVSLLIAAAGHAGFMRRAVEHIQVSVLALASDPTITDVRSVIETELLNFYKRHVYIIPDHKDYGFDLLIGVWCSGEFELFRTTNTTVNSIGSKACEYATIGWSADLAEYVVGQFYSGSVLSTHEAKFLATISVGAAKDYVEYCGGKTVVWTLSESQPYRTNQVKLAEVRRTEEYSNDFFSAVKGLIKVLDQDAPAKDDDEFVSMLTGEIRQQILKFKRNQRRR